MLQTFEQFRWLKLSFALGSLIWCFAAFTLPYSTDNSENNITKENTTTSPHIYHATWLLHHEKLSYLMNNIICLPLLLMLILHVQTPKSSSGINYIAQLFQPFASFILLASFYCPIGDYVTILLSLLWFLYSLFLAYMGFFHAFKLFYDSKIRKYNILICSGLIHILLSSTFAFLSRYSKEGIMGMTETHLMSIAVHVNIVGSIVPAFSGFALHRISYFQKLNFVREQFSNALNIVSFCLAIGGILFMISSISESRIELVAVFVISASQLSISFIVLGLLLPHLGKISTKLLLGVSSISLMISAFLSFLYSIGDLIEAVTISSNVMITLHGWFSVFGYIFCGLFGWMIQVSEKRSQIVE